MALALEVAYEYESFGYEANVQIPEADRFNLDVGSAFVIIAASNASPIRIQTATAHGKTSGDVVTITGVMGNSAANGTHVVIVIDADELDLFNSAGNGAFSRPSFTADDTTDTITSAGHGLSDDRAVRLFTAGTLPGGLSLATTYYVVNSTLNTFQLSATLGGSAIDITGTGTGAHSFAGGSLQAVLATLPASIVGIIRLTNEFLPWNVCSTPTPNPISPQTGPYMYVY
jgi:hypothetical protein